MRLSPDLRKESILDTAVQVSSEKGYNRITRRDVAEAARVSHGLVSFYFPTMKDLKVAVMKRAIETLVFPILVQGLGVYDPLTMDISDELKEATAMWMMESFE